jgi:putative transcriptional regulator
LALRYKIDVLEALKAKGLTTYTLRKNNLLSQSTIQKLREKKGLAWENIDNLCKLLDCQPGDLFEYVPEEARDA